MENDQAIDERRSYSAYNWVIRDDNTAIRDCDQSFFKRNGMAIPKVLKWFFRIEKMQTGDRKDINILYEGVSYCAHFICDTYDRIRLFWDKEFAYKLSAFEGLSPTPVVLCRKITDEVLSFEMLVGSDRQDYIQHAEWLVPCNLKIYDCFRAFDDLIKVDWRQSRQLSNVEVNDIIYIYTASPVKAVTHQCIVNKVRVPTLEIDDRGYYKNQTAIVDEGPFIEVQCIRQFDDLEGLRLDELKKHGIKGTIQGPIKVQDELHRHLNKMVLEQSSIDRFSDGNMKYVEAMADRDVSIVEDEKTAPSLSDDALLQIAKKKERKHVTTKTVITVQKQRDPYIAEYAKRRAAGKCQLCGNYAPFKDANGKPYLESHHIIWLANGGEDTIDNTVALCPNCHRKMHVVKDQNDVEYLKKLNFDNSRF